MCELTRVFHREYYDRVVITIEGHTGFAQRGSDIVCAAVSALVCTLLNCLRDEESAGRLRFITNIVRDGFVSLEVEYFDFAQERCSAITETCLTGLGLLAEEYPEYVKIE